MPVIPTLHACLEHAVSQGHPPAAQACVIQDGTVVHTSAHGKDHQCREATTNSRFDMASVTKVMATTTALATLIARREITLDQTVESVLGDNVFPIKNEITIRDLLAHRSGLPAWEPMFLRVREDPLGALLFNKPNAEAFARGREIVMERTLRAKATGERGTRVYSDLGFITLGAVVECVVMQRLDRLCTKAIFEPLGLEQTGFIDLAAGERATGHILPTGIRRPREPAPGQEHLYQAPKAYAEPRVGEVDDDNCFVMGGIAGHAGLFSNATDAATYGWKILEETEGANRLGAGETLRLFAQADKNTRGIERGLGFDRATGANSTAGPRFGQAGPKGAIGHLGFTGNSLWIDLDRRISVALCTNRTFPGREHTAGIRALRPEFHSRLVDALES